LNEDEVKGRSKLVLAVDVVVVVVVVVVLVTNEETKDLRAVTLHIHRTNEYV